MSRSSLESSSGSPTSSRSRDSTPTRNAATDPTNSSRRLPIDGNDIDNQGVARMRNAIKGLGDSGVSELTTAQAALDHVASLSRDERVQQLARSLGISDEKDLETFEDAFRQCMTQAEKPLSEEEQVALKAALKSLDAKTVKPNTSKSAQAWNTSVSATLTFLTGFGLVSFIAKMASIYKVPNAINFVNLAGPSILLLAEIITGKYREQGPNYPAADAGAYMTYDSLVAQMVGLDIEENGLLSRRMPDANRLTEIGRERTSLQVKVQSVCIGLMKQEFGHTLKMKSDSDSADVPSTLMQCLRSGLTCREPADDVAIAADTDEDLPSPELTADLNNAEHQISRQDGTPIFVIHGKPDANNFIVTFAGDDQKVNLRKECVPDKHKKLFESAASPLVGAARCRSALCDEAAFTLFGMFYVVSGSMGPWIVAKMDSRGVWVDLGLSLLMTLFGTQALLHAQNAFRSVFSGINISPTNAAHLPGEIKRLTAWGEQLRTMEDYLVGNLKTLREQAADSSQENNRSDGSLNTELEARLYALDGGDLPPELAAEINAHREALLVLQANKKDCIKQLKAAEMLGSKPLYMAREWVSKISEYLGNPQLLIAKLAGYSATYVLYTQVFIPQISVLKPPATVNVTSFNATSGLNVTQSATPDADEYGNYMAAFAFNGFAMLSVFLLRNLVITRGVHLGLQVATNSMKNLGQRVAGAAESSIDLAAQARDALAEKLRQIARPNEFHFS